MHTIRRSPGGIRSLGVALSVLIFVMGMLIVRGQRQAQSAELSPLETRVLGQSKWLRGGPESLRVTVTDHRSGAAVPAKVSISMTTATGNGGRETAIFTGETNKLGTLDMRFTVPAVEPGPYQVITRVSSKLGTDEVVQPVQVIESAHIMLSSDKPLYQPGQTMHLRALAINLANRAALVRSPIVFEIEDARGNKVFKQKEMLSDFGTAAVDFTLATEVNMGTFTLRATLPQGEVEKKVRVERYVLPKFKVALTTEKPYYLPGETVKGTVQADYFFGKPVSNGDVTIDVSTMDIGVTKLATLNGKTNADGGYDFEYALPAQFIGQPFEQGKAVVEFHASVIDGAQHLQEVFIARPVVKDPILLAIVPESRSLLPGLSNRVFIAAATPDGTPLRGIELTVNVDRGNATRLRTDNLGLAVYSFVPVAKSPAQATLNVRAVGRDGRVATTTQTLAVSPSQEGILLRTSQSLAKVGDRIYVSMISTTKSGTIYLDVLRDKQTVLTKALAVQNGQAAINLPITPEMTGTLVLHAYKILPNEDIVRDTQVIVVSPASEIAIGVNFDKNDYRPGDDAQLTFTVSDQRNNPLVAALGLAIVDESVFALSELQPGLEKIYFTLEKELMEPKYEIHGLTPIDLILRPIDPIGPMPLERPVVIRDIERQRAAEMLFAAAPLQDGFDFRVNTYQQRWEKMKPEVIAEMVKVVNVIVQAVNDYRQKTGKSLTAEETLFRLVDTGYLKAEALKDRWGNFYKSDLRGAKNYDGWFTLGSAGPDGRWDTLDDVLNVGRFQRIPRGRGGIGGPVVLDDVDFMEEGIIMARNGVEGPMAMAAMAPGAVGDKLAGGAGVTGAAGGASEPVRIREYFPETMYWNPLIITDRNGKASISVPVADSITTWRMSLLANTPLGMLGSGSAPLRVFQPFFVDIDFPVFLTQHDTVAVPVAIYNYLPGPQEVTLKLDLEPWFALQGPSVQAVHLEKNEVKVAYFPIEVKSIGRFTFTVHADGAKMSDAVRRSIDILPDGKEFRQAINDTLPQGRVEKTVTIPAEAIEGSANVWVKLYPGTFSQVVEGLDSMLRMPNGCFEQTSSTTYPNILVLDYLNATKRINPELKMKAEQYINVGYQRLVTYECKGGGFSWFGNEPAHQILTAYGLLEFSDMARVHEVDPALIARVQGWLAGKQKADGTWEETSQGIAEGIINRQTGALRSTAYIAWALAESGYTGPQVARAVQYVKAHRDEAKDPYTLAVLLNLLAKTERNGETTAAVAKALIDAAKVTDKTAWWEGDTQTFTGAKKESADLETTGMAAFGLVKWGRDSNFTNKVLTYLVQSKDSFGTWSTTQGTVWSLKALLYASANGVGGGKGTVKVIANGQPAATIEITEENSDVMRQIDLTALVKGGENAITLEYAGEGAPLYQIVSRYFIPWAQVERMPEMKPPLTLAVKYDKTTLAENDTATVTVTITATPDATVEMPLIDVGVPPGFTVDPEELEKAVAAKTISKYTLAARQIIIYIEKMTPGQTINLNYRLKAKYPIKARTPQSKAFPYYNPDQAGISAPQDIRVSK